MMNRLRPQRQANTLIILACYAALCGLQAEAAPVVSETEAARRLIQFGYLPPVDPGSDSTISEEAMSHALSEYQSFMGIDVTGNMNVETAHMMTLPRCGVKDNVGLRTGGRARRYALNGSKWVKKYLTYKIGKYPNSLDRTDVDEEIARAFAVWSNHTDLRFSPKTGEVDIEIRFERRDHGDERPFDGSSSSTIAHAFTPVDGGDVHFNDEAHWTINIDRGFNLFQTAMHVIGHSLGLDHSHIESSVMNPNVPSYNPNFKLNSDDIAGIQALYGSKTNAAPRICEDPSIDAIFTAADGHTYAFKGNYYWKLTTNEIAAEHPKLIYEKWSGLPGNIDAAFQYQDWTYFFKGSKYWRYVDEQTDEIFPQRISQAFPGIPDDIDAATVWTGDGKIYFYKGSQFWKFDFAQRVNPESISKWRGLPDNLDAAVVYNGYTFFFKGGSYYRFNDITFSVDGGEPAFPRPNGGWFDCSMNSSS